MERSKNHLKNYYKPTHSFYYVNPLAPKKM